MKTALDIESWARRDHFHFFRQFEEPFFGLTATVDCRAAYADAGKKLDTAAASLNEAWENASSPPQGSPFGDRIELWKRFIARQAEYQAALDAWQKTPKPVASDGTRPGEGGSR